MRAAYGSGLTFSETARSVERSTSVIWSRRRVFIFFEMSSTRYVDV